MKKLFFFLSMAMLCISMAHADEPVHGIYATYDGATVVYKLESVPTVTYGKNGNDQVAILSFSDETAPVEFTLAGGKELVITYCEYTPTGIDDIITDKVTMDNRNGRKLIVGGRLIIVDKNGIQYDAAGRRLQ